jgi:hypothetical protein
METRDFRDLTEAYYQVYQGQELDESEKWIQKAIEKPGSLHKQLGVSEDEKISAKKLTSAAKKGGKLGKRARLAKTLKSLHKEEVDLYDIILSHLIDEGYAETTEAAETIMVNMSEEWREDIIEKFVSPYEGKTTYKNIQGHSPATKAMQKSDELQRTEPGSERQKKQTRRSQQLNRMFQAARRA